MAARSQPKTQRRPSKRWSQEVTPRHSDALDLKKGAHPQRSQEDRRLAQELGTGEHAPQIGAHQSCGKSIDKAERAPREKAKDELRKAFGKDARPR